MQAVMDPIYYPDLWRKLGAGKQQAFGVSVTSAKSCDPCKPLAKPASPAIKGHTFSLEPPACLELVVGCAYAMHICAALPTRLGKRSVQGRCAYLGAIWQ